MRLMDEASAKGMAQRANASIHHLRSQLAKVVPMDAATLDLVAAYYIKHRLAKLDKYMGTASVKHGALLSEHAVAAAIIIVTPPA